MTARKRKAKRKVTAKRARSPRRARPSRSSEQRQLLLAVEQLRVSVDRLVELLERAVPAQPRDIERAAGQLTFTQRFPFGAWRSTDAQQRWALDFSDNGCDWVERNAAGGTLRRQVELTRDRGGWVIQRPNDAEVLAFLGVTPQIASEIETIGPQPSFMRLVVQDDHIQGEWNHLRWTLNANGHVQSIEQPGSVPATVAVFTLTYVAGSDAGWFKANASEQLTFDQEGQEGSRFHSRWLQWPGGSSGVTLGRGHDMKERTVAMVRDELVGVGVAPALADAFAAGATLSGEHARDFVLQRRDICGNISPAQQLRLFRADYAALAADTKRICQKADVIAKYGAVDFAKLDPRIWAVAVDLRFRGDYTPASRALIQKAIAQNDLATFRKVLSNAASWPGVPKARFDARVAALM